MKDVQLPVLKYKLCATPHMVWREDGGKAISGPGEVFLRNLGAISRDLGAISAILEGFSAKSDPKRAEFEHHNLFLGIGCVEKIK